MREPWYMPWLVRNRLCLSVTETNFFNSCNFVTADSLNPLFEKTAPPPLNGLIVKTLAKTK